MKKLPLPILLALAGCANDAQVAQTRPPTSKYCKFRKIGGLRSI